MTSSEFFKGLKILHLALTLVPLVFLIALIGLSVEGTVPILQEAESEITPLLDILCVVYGALGVAGALVIFNKLGKSAALKENLSQKLVGFRYASLIRLAAIEGAALLGCVSYLLTKSNIALVVAVFLITILVRMKPSKKEMEKLLQLSPSDIQKLNSDDQEVLSSSNFNSTKL